MDFNSIICGDCAKVLTGFPADCIDLTVTSPPYDNLRHYNGYAFDFEPIAQELWRVTKPGGVVVWVVADATVNGSETGTSFRQALGFMEIGFRLHDTMIYKNTKPPLTHNRYEQKFEFMFVFCKEKLKTFNPLMVSIESNRRKRYAGYKNAYKSNNKAIRARDEHIIRRKNHKIKENIWFFINNFYGGDNISALHPAPFPEALARDHIISWSNPGDIVLDPMCGSGTTLKMAKEQGRQFIGIDISQEYCDLARRRVEGAKVPLFVMLPETNGKAEPEQLELVSSGL